MSTSSEPGILSHARYGKDIIRVLRVVREGKLHHVVEYNVTALLEGDIHVSFTKADNAVVVATDSIKNITYYLAKTSPHILHPERFALHLGTFLVSKYPHIHKAFITVQQLRWSRIQVDEKAHNHSFLRDGEDKRTVKVEIDATQGKDKLVAKVEAGIKDLLVLKTTGSGFENYVKDEFTTLVPVPDRILSTSIDLAYTFAPIPVPAPSAAGKEFGLQSAGEGDVWDGETAASLARKVTLEVFAVDESESVQATLYKMAQHILSLNKFVQTVSYSLPNKHYVPVDMKYIGLDNMTPRVSEKDRSGGVRTAGRTEWIDLSYDLEEMKRDQTAGTYVLCEEEGWRH